MTCFLNTISHIENNRRKNLVHIVIVSVDTIFTAPHYSSNEINNQFLCFGIDEKLHIIRLGHFSQTSCVDIHFAVAE